VVGAATRGTARGTRCLATSRGDLLGRIRACVQAPIRHDRPLACARLTARAPRGPGLRRAFYTMEPREERCVLPRCLTVTHRIANARPSQETVGPMEHQIAALGACGRCRVVGAGPDVAGMGRPRSRPPLGSPPRPLGAQVYISRHLARSDTLGRSIVFAVCATGEPLRRWVSCTTSTLCLWRESNRSLIRAARWHDTPLSTGSGQLL